MMTTVQIILMTPACKARCDWGVQDHQRSAQQQTVLYACKCCVQITAYNIMHSLDAAADRSGMAFVRATLGSKANEHEEDIRKERLWSMSLFLQEELQPVLLHPNVEQVSITRHRMAFCW
jgi:hypothetical protein